MVETKAGHTAGAVQVSDTLDVDLAAERGVGTAELRGLAAEDTSLGVWAPGSHGAWSSSGEGCKGEDDGGVVHVDGLSGKMFFRGNMFE